VRPRVTNSIMYRTRQRAKAAPVRRRIVRPRRSAALPKPSEFRKLPKAMQDRLFREQAALAAETYLANPELSIEDSEPIHRY